MENQLLLVILGIQTAVIVVIGVIAVRVGGRAKALTQRMDAVIDFFSPKVEKLMDETETVLRSCEEISAGLRDITQSAKETAEDVTETVRDTRERAEQHIEEIDHVVSNAIDRTQIAADYFTRSVIPQFVEVTAMVKGISATIEYLRGGKPLAD